MSEYNHGHKLDCENDCCCEAEHEHRHEHGCAGGCGCCGHDEEEKEETFLSKILLGVSVVLIIIGLFLKTATVFSMILGIAAVVLAAYPLLFTVYDDIKARKFTEVELMLISVVAACCIGELRDAALVAVLYRIGEMLEDRAVENSHRAIDSVAKIQQDFAHIIREDGTTEKVHADDVPVGSRISVLPTSVSRLTASLSPEFPPPTLRQLRAKACR